MNLPISAYTRITLLVQQDISKLTIAVAIRNFGLGMVTLFEPVYLYLYFDRSLPLTLFYFAAGWGLYALLATWGGKIVAVLGAARSMLISFFLYLAYYALLLLFPVSFFYVPAAVAVGAVGMVFFWPAFQTDFTRLSTPERRGRQVGRTALLFLPVIAGPFVGGVILSELGYPGLFTAVLVATASAAIPLFYASHSKEAYTDSFQVAWSRVFAKAHWKETVGYAANGIEIMVNSYLWPLFLFIAAVSFSQIGALTSVALVASSMFMLYMGRASDTEDRAWLLRAGALWTAVAWILKYFVASAFDALLAHTVYRTARAAAGVPFQTLFYEKAARRNEEADEYVVYREIAANLGRALFFGGLGALFLFAPEIPLKTSFLAAAVFSLGFMLIAKLPHITLRTIL